VALASAGATFMLLPGVCYIRQAFTCRVASARAPNDLRLDQPSMTIRRGGWTLAAAKIKL
jgi:hypothetical protein